MTIETTPHTKTLTLDQHEADVVAEALETLMAVHMGTDRWISIVMEASPMLEQLTGRLPSFPMDDEAWEVVEAEPFRWPADLVAGLAIVMVVAVAATMIAAALVLR